MITDPVKSTLKQERKPVLAESSADKTVSESAVALQASVASEPRGKAIYTCPMHPEVQAGPSRRLPQVRHDAGTEDGNSGYG